MYALPGAVMARLGDERAARYAGRVVTAALTAGLLAVAAAAWDRRAGPLSLLGLALAASPMLLFLGAALGTNGLEAAGSLCLFALVLRGARPGGAPRWLWPAVGVAGPLTATSRSTGPVRVLCAALLALAVLAALDALVFTQTRFPVYGRYLLPVVVVVPLLAGEVLTRRVGRVPAGLRRLAPPAVVLAVAAVHLVGTWFDARRYAVGVHGPVLFLQQARWHPPAGFGPWLALAAAGGLALTVAVLPPPARAPIGSGGHRAPS